MRDRRSRNWATARPARAVDAIVSEQLTYFLEQNPTVAKIICEKSILAQRARDAASKARELTRRKISARRHGASRKTGRLFRQESGKLRDLHRRGRFRRRFCERRPDIDPTQAILPLRGKILNVEKARLDKIYGNAEIKCYDHGIWYRYS